MEPNQVQTRENQAFEAEQLAENRGYDVVPDKGGIC